MKKTPDITLDEWLEAVKASGRPKNPPPGYFTAKEITEKLGFEFKQTSGLTALRLRKLVKKNLLTIIKGSHRRNFYKLVIPNELA